MGISAVSTYVRACVTFPHPYDAFLYLCCTCPSLLRAHPVEIRPRSLCCESFSLGAFGRVRDLVSYLLRLVIEIMLVRAIDGCK